MAKKLSAKRRRQGVVPLSQDHGANSGGVSRKASCRHKWSEAVVGLRTHQWERGCMKCATYQHTLTYSNPGGRMNPWLHGPMLPEREWRRAFVNMLNESRGWI